MSEFTYDLAVTPTLNGVPQDTIQVHAGESESQPVSGMISVHLEAGQSAEFSFPEGGRGAGIFGTGPFTIDIGVVIPLKEFPGTAGPYKVGFFLPMLVPPGATIIVTAPSDAAVAIFVLGAITVHPEPSPSEVDVAILGWSDGVVNGGQTRVGMWSAQRDPAVPFSARASVPVVVGGTLRRHLVHVDENTTLFPTTFRVFQATILSQIITVPAGATGSFGQDVPGESIVVTETPIRFVAVSGGPGGLIRFAESVEYLPA